MVSPVRKYDYMAGRDAQIIAPPYRRRVYVPTTIEYWWEQASCHSLPAELFEPSFRTANSRLSKAQVVHLNEERFKTAQAACNDCPVWDMCYKKATPEDFFYTMRAGIEPAQFTKYKETGKILYRGNQDRGLKATCMRGHNNWKTWGAARPRRKCVDCDKMTIEQKKEFDKVNGIVGV